MDDRRAAAVNSGYRSGAPDPRTHREDAEIAEHAQCLHCGHVGLIYHPYVRQLGAHMSYIAILVCPVCGLQDEM